MWTAFHLYFASYQMSIMPHFTAFSTWAFAVFSGFHLIESTVRLEQSFGKISEAPTKSGIKKRH